jgi:glycosyltransferase involved in cell wall biosynthesis
VIVPAFNALPWMAETLRSICAQLMRDIEVIVVDDGSTDGTREFVTHFGQADRRVRCIAQRNGGIAEARNAGAAVAVGEFITFLDADDLWAPDKLTRQLELIQGRRDAAALTGIRRFSVTTEGVRELAETRPPSGDRSAGYLRSLMFLRSSEMVGIATCLAPRSEWASLGGYDASLSTAEDWDMWFRLARKFELLTVPGEPLQFYRKRADSVTTNSRVDRNFVAWRSILRKQLTMGGVSRADVRRAITSKRIECAETCRVQGDAASALRLLAGSLADPAVVLRPDFYVACARLVRGS